MTQARGAPDVSARMTDVLREHQTTALTMRTHVVIDRGSTSMSASWESYNSTVADEEQDW